MWLARGPMLNNIWVPTVPALRYFRIHLHQNPTNSVAHPLKLDVFKAILELALQELDRDTPINSTCQSFLPALCSTCARDLCGLLDAIPARSLDPLDSQSRL